MRCKNCGFENEDNRYICQNCGSPLFDEEEIPAAADDSNNYNEQNDNKESSPE